SDSPSVVEGLLMAGVDVFRLNASHGPQEKHAERICTARKASEQFGKHVGILLDLQGPKIRLENFENSRCELQTGASFTITVERVVGNRERASTSYARFARDVKAGDRVLLADGAVEMRAVKTDGVSVRCEVLCGGEIGDNKGINLPGVQVSAPSLT